MNVPDDNGVLVGRWGGDYSDGIEPWKWASSKTILDQFMKEKQPVKYAQCWVFSAVLTTGNCFATYLSVRMFAISFWLKIESNIGVRYRSRNPNPRVNG